MTYYRIQQASRDAAELLNPDNWNSTHWFSGSTRRGVSVCADIETLAAYYALSGGDTTDTVLIEIKGWDSEDTDEDASAGAQLIDPYEIVSITPLDDVTEFWTAYHDAMAI